MSVMKYGGLISAVVIVVAIIYKRRVDDQLNQELQRVLSSLLRAEKKAVVPPRIRVAVGLGACEDQVADAVPVLQGLGIDPPEISKHYDSIHNKQELSEAFAYFFSHGAAGERYIHDKVMFNKMVKVADGLPKTKWIIGGNAPVMANRLAVEGCEVLLGARMTQSQTKELHKHVRVAGKYIENEDVHMILEYKTGEKWGSFQTPRANRFIVHSDASNPTLESLEAFSAELAAFKPEAVVIGGLQMMDNYPFKEGERQERLTALQKTLAGISPLTKIHFEFASFAEVEMLFDLQKYVIPYSDSLGMNEQELPNLYSLLSYGNISLIADAYPRTASVLDQMRFVYSTLRKTAEINGQRKLTRLHVHTLAFQAIITTKGSAWQNTMSATAKAALTANRHVCGSADIDTSKSRIIMDDSFSVSRKEGSQRMLFKHDRPVSCWEEDDFEICVSPVLVCTEIFKTAGGGDNISSAALSVQI